MLTLNSWVTLIAKATPEVVFAGLTGNVAINNIPLLRDRGMPNMAQVNNIFAVYVRTGMSLGDLQ
jgi:hypothetical protein